MTKTQNTPAAHSQPAMVFSTVITNPAHADLIRRISNLLSHFDEHQDRCVKCWWGGLDNGCDLGIGFGERIAELRVLHDATEPTITLSNRTGDAVTYHGSVACQHGPATFVGWCTCWENDHDTRCDGFELATKNGAIKHVQHKSFTNVGISAS